LSVPHLDPQKTSPRRTQKVDTRLMKGL
jgi:hypothetical protein